MVVPRRLCHSKRTSFLVPYKYRVKTVGVLEVKDTLLPKDCELKYKTKGEEKDSEIV